MINENGSSSWIACPWRLVLLLVLLCGVTVTTAGCSGCRQETLAEKRARKQKEEAERKEKEKKEKKKPKKDFEYTRMELQPGDTSKRFNQIKPGHYITCTQNIVANNFDFQARVDSSALDSSLHPVPAPKTPYSMVYTRNIGLPKGQGKVVETLYYIPQKSTTNSNLITLQSAMRSRRGGSSFPAVQEATTRMKAHEYFFMVLSGSPDSYTYLKRIDSVLPPMNEYSTEEKLQYYYVINPTIDRRVPVPAHPFSWTTIAFVLWDDLDPDLLSPTQQDSMLDWLHWGGQLIISGPESLDTLRGSFLDAYLPVTSSEATELRQPDFASLNDYWSLSYIKDKKREELDLNVSDEKPMLGLKFELHPQARLMRDTGGLVAERQIGQGRVVITAFPLSEKRVLNWKSYDNLLNNALMRRPARTFEADRQMGDFISPKFTFAKYGMSFHRDPRLSTTLRYFSRDVGSGGNASLRLPKRSGERAEKPRSDSEAWQTSGYVGSGNGGIAAWNDDSGAANASRQLLVDAAGIKIPDASFVLKVLLSYLAILVPANWCLFRLIRRVEWAWIAAPLIAIVGAGAVIKLAQLDIGFARSRSEVGTLELQAGYARAHLTRFTALYTSLATSYSVVYDDPNTAVQPFWTRDQSVPSSRAAVVRCHREREATLSGFQIKGNDTQNLHTEQMIDVGGAFTLTGDADQGYQLRNETNLKLQDAGVLYRHPKDGSVQLSWLGEVQPQTSLPLKFDAAQNNTSWFPQWDENNITFSHDKEVALLLKTNDKNSDQHLEMAELPADHPLIEAFVTFDGGLDSKEQEKNGLLSRAELTEWCRQQRSGTVSLGKLFDVATAQLRLLPGEMRLLGWTEQDPGGMTVRPVAPQKDLRLLVLVHLKRPAFKQVVSDTNSKYQFVDTELEEGIATFGAYVDDINPELVQIYNLKVNEGIVITEIRDGGGAQFGRLRVGDVLLTIQEEPVKNALDFRKLLRKLPTNRPIEVVYNRNGKKEVTDITLQPFNSLQP